MSPRYSKCIRVLVLRHWHIGNEIMYWLVSGSKVPCESQIGVAGFLDRVVSCDIMAYAGGRG